MKYQEDLTLKSERPIEPELLIALGQQLQEKNIELYFLDTETYCFDECKKMIIEQGVRNILSIERLQEAVLPKVEKRDSRDLLIRVLSNQLQALLPSESLVIIDPYFLPKNLRDSSDYLNVCREVFGPIVPKITSVSFITKPDYDVVLYQSIKRILATMNPRASVNHKTTEDFHDRFWIVDEKKGLFLGTSLSGVGRKYALTDYMRDDDIAFIMGELRRLNLV